MEGLSIIIPTLNEEKYIGGLLDCLAKQTFRDFEVIIVDGGSKDQTSQIVQKYSGLNLRMFYSDKDLSYNRNKGAFKAKNDLLLFLDADILLDSNYLEVSLTEIKNRNLDIACSVLKPIEGNWYNSLFIGICNRVLKISQHIKPMGYGCCLFTRRKIHDSVGGWDSVIGWGNDLNYVKRMSKLNRFGMLGTSIHYSMRRFEEFGTKRTIKKFVLAYYYTLTEQDHKIAGIGYDFGEFNNENKQKNTTN